MKGGDEMIPVKITLVRQTYKGYPQGFKVYFDGVKYPRIRGHHYTHLKEIEALKFALNEYKILNGYKIEEVTK